MEEEKKTAQAWYEQLHEPKGVVIYDADGFRDDWVYSWQQELLTKTEYYYKISMCTMSYPKGYTDVK